MKPFRAHPQSEKSVKGRAITEHCHNWQRCRSYAFRRFCGDDGKRIGFLAVLTVGSLAFALRQRIEEIFSFQAVIVRHRRLSS
jgi:hypothetical protein